MALLRLTQFQYWPELEFSEQRLREGALIENYELIRSELVIPVGSAFRPYATQPVVPRRHTALLSARSPQAFIPRIARYLRPPFQGSAGETIADVSELEIGQISYLLHKNGADQGLKRTFRSLRDVRNALAHLEPVTAEQALSKEIMGHSL